MIASDAGKAQDEAARRSGDMFAWKYPLFALLLVMAQPLLIHIGAFLLSLILFFVTCLVLIVFLLAGLVSLFRERVKRGAALMLGPLVFIPIYALHLGWIFAVPFDLIRLYYHQDEYATVINALPPAERASRLVIFDWGSAGIVTSGINYAVVYDESGEIELPDLARTDEWVERARRETGFFIGNKDCSTFAYRLRGHFYKAETSCPF